MLAANPAPEGPVPAAELHPAVVTDADCEARITALRSRGAQHHDPVGLRYIEALARRTAAQSGLVRRLLEDKLARALDACDARCDQAQCDGPAASAHATETAAAAEAARAADHGTERPLAALLRHVARHAAQPAAPPGHAVDVTSASPAWTELRALRQSGDTWKRLRAELQLHRSLEKAPDNPGPLNSQLLLLRALQVMHDLSPSYLSRYMAQVEALLWLDAATNGGAAAPGQPPRREPDKRRRTGRGKAA